MLKSTTASLKPAEVEKKWIHIDAEGVVVGRLATFIANRLRGKHRGDYTPHVDCGDYVVVTNVDKVVFTGKKNTDKIYYRHTGHPGGVKQTTPEKVLNGRFPERVLEKAVERMLPKESPLARKQMTHLRLFAGSAHTHEAQSPETIDFKSASPKNTPERLSMTDVTAENTAAAPEAAPTEALTGFDALKGMQTPGAGEEHPVYVQKLDAQGRAYSTGKRKNAIARVWIKPGTGKITINGKDQMQYFAREILRMMIAQPLEVTDRVTQFDVDCTVQGSGLSGQAGAIRHGLSHALTHYEPALRPVLKPHGFLTRDARVVERKKYGRAKARKSFQFSKR